MSKKLFGKFFIFLLVVGLLFAVAPTRQVEAATRDVCPSGCTYSTINAALTASIAGDTITVAAGTYTENLVINKSITLTGAGRNVTTITAANPASDTIDVTAAGVTISGFKVTGTTGVTADGIWVSANNCTITDNELSNNGQNGISITSTNNTVTHNIITGNSTNSTQGAGVALFTGGNSVQFNTITGNGGYGGIGSISSTANNISKNWWGSATGPTHASNPGGTGDVLWTNQSISLLTYIPWCGDAACTTLVPPVHNVTRNTYFNTIQAAIDATGTLAGDVIEVGAGTYTESLNVNKGVTLRAADLIETVVLSDTEAPGVWYPDRYRPAVFQSATWEGRNAIQHGVRAVDGQGSRPAGYSDTFYNTQGRKYQTSLTGSVQRMSIDMWVNSTWSSSQVYSGLWSTGLDLSDAVSAYPIIAWRSTTGATPGFYIWDYRDGVNAWALVKAAEAGDYNKWHTLAFELRVGQGVQYYLDGQHAGALLPDTATTSLENVILNVYNYGADYDVYWDNFSTSGVSIVGQTTVNASNVTVDGFNMSNPGASYGMVVNPGFSNVTITNNIFENIGGITYDGYVKGIYLLNGPDNVTIKSNTFRNIHSGTTQSANAVYSGVSSATDPATGLVIRNNVFENITSASKGGYGILLNNGAMNTSGGNPGAIIEGNSFNGISGGWTHAIGLEGPTPGALVNRNTFSGLTASGADKAAVFFEDNTGLATTSITNNQFLNAGFGVAVHPDMEPHGTVLATPNWWGQLTGPAAGQIVGNASYIPWCANAACTEFAGPVTNITQHKGYATIQAAIDEAANNDAITVAAGTYEGFSVVGKTGIKITGAGDNATIIAPTALINTGVGHKYTPSMLASVFVNNSTGITIEGMQIQSTTAAPGASGADAIVFWNNSTGSIKESIVQGLYTINGAQTGQGIAVDGGTSVLSLVNTDISGFQKNAIDVVDGNGGTTAGNLKVNVSGGTITGAGPTTAIAQNGVVYFNRGGGVLGGSITGATISGFDYTPTSDEATGILAYGLGGGTLTVTGNTFGASEVSMTDNTGTLNLNAILLANTFPVGSAVVGDSIMIPLTKLYMNPATITKDINGGQQVVEIMVTDVEDMTAYHMEVTFDYTKLQVVKVENGGLLSSEHTTVVEEPGKDPGNTTGRLKFGAYLQAIGGVNYPVSGSGSLVKITFQPINFGETSFTIDGALSALYDWPNAFPIPYEVTTGETDVNIVGFGPGVPFGYVAYEAAPNGWLRGVSTDFTIVGADLTDATSLVVKLWGGDGGTILLQTNTANLSGTLFDGFTGFTSPFDIFGNFNYANDGYWTNVRATQYGQTEAPTCVEATATLAGGTVITKKYCGPLNPGDRSLLLRGTIEPDGGTGQVPGGEPLNITNVNDTVSYLGLIEWYPANEAIGRTEGNRVGVEINAPTAFDTTGTTFTVFGNTYTWNDVNDGDNFVWIYPKVTEVPQSWNIVVNWGGNITQTFTVKVLTDSTLNTPPLPTITSTDVVGPYIPGVPREFNITMSNLGGAIYEWMIFDYTVKGVSKSDIASFEYSIGGSSWIVMGSRSTETYVDCTVEGVASICGQFGLAPDGFGPVGPDFISTTTFRINFKNGKTADLPLNLTLKGKKTGTETDWTVLQTFTAAVEVYENVQVTGTVPVYYLVGDPGISTITVTNPAGGAPYGNHIEFNLTILNAVKTDITSATCTYGTVTLDILNMLSEVGSNLTGTLFPADGAFNVSAPFNMTISCTTVFNTAKSYTATSEMKYVVGTNKYTVATNTATAVVYPKPAIVSPLLPGSFQQGVAKDITINVNNVGTMHTPNSFTLRLALPAGTVVVYGANTYTCTATGCDIPVTLSAGDNALPMTVTFNAPSTADVTISLVDPTVDPGRILVTITGPNVVHASIALVTGSVTMQGRNTYNYAKFTLTGAQIGYGPYHSTSNAAGGLSFANIIADVYTVTTEMPRYLNITSGMAKQITLSGNDALPALWMRAGNAVWTDNVINGSDASRVGSDWGGSGSTDLTINHGDVNFDNTVNIQDLALVGGNYDLISANAYATWLP